MPGPPPNPTSRKQAGNQAHTWTVLPAGGYDGEIPSWPLIRCKVREDALWQEIWRTPQAAAWSRMGWSHDVAMYVRWLTVGDDPDASMSERLKAAAESRAWSDRLGLNPQAMLRNRWKVSADEVAERRTEKSSAGKSRRKFKAVDGAVAGS